MPLCASVYMCLVVTCCERADLLAFVRGVYPWVSHVPIGILGQVWYLIVSIPDLCSLTYLHCIFTQCVGPIHMHSFINVGIDTYVSNFTYGLM